MSETLDPVAIADLKLGAGDSLKPITALGTARTATDPKMVALSEVIDALNDRFGDESFTRSQQQSWVEANLRELLSDPTLVTQANANGLTQFLESQDFQDAISTTLMDNQQAFEKMTEMPPTRSASTATSLRRWASCSTSGRRHRTSTVGAMPTPHQSRQATPQERVTKTPDVHLRAGRRRVVVCKTNRL